METGHFVLVTRLKKDCNSLLAITEIFISRKLVNYGTSSVSVIDACGLQLLCAGRNVALFTYSGNFLILLFVNSRHLKHLSLHCDKKVGSSFSIYAPTAWNNLPPHSCTTLSRFLRASAMLKHVLDIGWTSVRLSVCLSVRHTPVLYQNG